MVVRKRIYFKSAEEEGQLAENIHRVLSLNNPLVIQINRVLEHRGKAFLIDYEYVPETLNKNPRISN